MASNRLGRTNDDIQRVLSELLRRIKDPRVHPAEDLSPFLNCFKKGLKSSAGWLRHELGQVLDLRYTPELIFELDRSMEYGAHISKLLSDLEVTGKSEEENDD